jgi:dienelactone hydrolase
MNWIAGCCLALIAAQDDQAVRQELARQAARLERDFLPGVGAELFEQMRPGLRRDYLEMLGLHPLPDRTPLKATITGMLDFPDFKVEKLHYQSRPGLYVTANLYLPKQAGPHPAILYSCGHAGRKRDGNKTAYQDHGIWFAKHGYVCLVVDTLQLGEIGAVHHGTYREQRWWWQSAGYTPAGVECWNAVRGLDYLETRPEVDKTRIGATGISGGGAATFWIAAADPRVKAAAPVSGMADLGYYVAEDGVDGHCDCMFLYNTRRWNWTQIAALIAPRPLLFVNSDNDPIFPMSANERVIARLEHLYARFGRSDQVDALVSIGGHAYRQDLRRGIFEWFNRHLKEDARPVLDPDAGLASPIPGAELRVFLEDKDLPADERNTRIDEDFAPVSRPPLPAEGVFPDWQAALKARLQRVVFGPELPIERSPEFREGTLIAPSGEDARWAAPFVRNTPHQLLPDPRQWTRKNPPNTIERSLALLGDTRDGRLTRKLYAAMHGGARRVLGRGPEGVAAAYAAIFAPDIEEVVIVDPTSTHRNGPHYLGVLQTLDIPDALGLLAPRRLVLVNAKDAAFDRTAEIYRLAGCADRLHRR